ncbi:unnamed protein product [Caenorhabditis nigoni]
MRGGYQVVHQDKRHVAKSMKNVERREFSFSVQCSDESKKLRVPSDAITDRARCRIRPTMPTKSANCVRP